MKFLYILIALFSIVLKAQTPNILFKLSQKTPFYYTERQIEYNNVSYSNSNTEILIYNVDLKYCRGIRLEDLEPIIIERKYLNQEELKIDEINKLNLNKDEAITLAKGEINEQIQKKIETQKLLETEYKKMGLVIINSQFTNNEVLDPHVVLKILNEKYGSSSNSSSTNSDYLLKKTNNYKSLGLEIKNAYEKDIKYIRFNLIPYNRVEDRIQTALIKTEKIEIIGPFKNNSIDYFIFKNIWGDENNIIEFVMVSDIKVTFMDNTELSIKDPKNQFISKTNKIQSSF